MSINFYQYEVAKVLPIVQKCQNVTAKHKKIRKSGL